MGTRVALSGVDHRSASQIEARATVRTLGQALLGGEGPPDGKATGNGSIEPLYEARLSAQRVSVPVRPALADELAKAIQRPQDIKKLDTSRSMSVAGKMAGAAKILSGGLMLLNFSKLLDDVDSGMSHEMDEARTKLMMGKFAMGAFVSEMTGDLLEKLGEQRLKNMMGRIGANVPRALQWFGRFLGFGVGVLLGLWDISKGIDEDKKGDAGLANAYYLSGGMGIAVGGLMFSVAMGWIALGPLGWALLAVGFVVWLGATLFVETSKDNKVQEWLARCHFGMSAEKYPDVATHIHQYKLATGN